MISTFTVLTTPNWLLNLCVCVCACVCVIHEKRENVGTANTRALRSETWWVTSAQHKSNLRITLLWHKMPSDVMKCSFKPTSSRTRVFTLSLNWALQTAASTAKTEKELSRFAFRVKLTSELSLKMWRFFCSDVRGEYSTWINVLRYFSSLPMRTNNPKNKNINQSNKNGFSNALC